MNFALHRGSCIHLIATNVIMWTEN